MANIGGLFYAQISWCGLWPPTFELASSTWDIAKRSHEKFADGKSKSQEEIKALFDQKFHVR